jgi:uncharacterized protein (DUF2336 family)
MKDNQLVIEDLKTKSASERAAIAVRVGKSLSLDLEKVERVAIEELAKVLALDTAENVRQSLVKEVMNCPYLPIDIAKQIANDVSSVSENFLHHYQGTDDSLLEKLARECEEKAREVLASRHNLPEPASFAISEAGGEVSIYNLMDNQSAIISERVCAVVTTRFNGNSNVMENMSKRTDLPLASVVLLIDHLTEEVADNLIKKYKIGEDLAHYISGQAKLATIDDELSKTSVPELEVYFKALNDDGLLNNGMLLQILKSKDIDKFSVAVSIRSGIASYKVLKILNSNDKGNFFRLMDKLKVNNSLASVIYQAYQESQMPDIFEDKDEQKL